MRVFKENQMGVYFGKQWAAVRTKSGEIRTPPQTWDPLKCSVTCHGHWPSLAKLPPMIRDVERCCPQSKTEGGGSVRNGATSITKWLI